MPESTAGEGPSGNRMSRLAQGSGFMHQPQVHPAPSAQHRRGGGDSFPPIQSRSDASNFVFGELDQKAQVSSFVQTSLISGCPSTWVIPTLSSTDSKKIFFPLINIPKLRHQSAPNFSTFLHETLQPKATKPQGPHRQKETQVGSCTSSRAEL